MRILGISAFYHDSAAALIEDGRIVADTGRVVKPKEPQALAEALCELVDMDPGRGIGWGGLDDGASKSISACRPWWPSTKHYTRGYSRVCGNAGFLDRFQGRDAGAMRASVSRMAETLRPCEDGCVLPLLSLFDTIQL